MNRLANVVIAAVLLGALLPLLILVAIAVRAAIGSPVIFRQDRPGKDGQIFRLLKFRTMRDLTDANGNILADHERMTPLGALLRRTSLDELPELWNIIRGDMNLVGPRPLLVEYLPLYSERQKRRHEVLPGLTGWAQVNGRNSLSWEEKFELDVWYVDHRSLWLDIKILLMTIMAIFRTGETSQEGHVTAEKFKGTR